MLDHGEHCKQGINSIVNGHEMFQILCDLKSILHSHFARKRIIQEENILCHL
jgi:5'-deoxynucleotidase YfbR-like HD superfamily hydrolase